MARIRSINPSAPSDEDVATMSIHARYVWAYLPCFADRLGRLKDSAFSLKHDILPADDVDMDAVLNELAARQHIHRYEVAGKKYIQIRNFAKYQTPHVREVDSTIPAAPRVPSTTKAVLGLVPTQTQPETSTPIPDPDPGPDPIPSPGDVDPGKQGLTTSASGAQASGDPGTPQTWFELLRAFELLWAKRWPTRIFTRDRFDDKEAIAVLEQVPASERGSLRPAMQSYLDCADQGLVKAEHPFRLFARNFGRFRNGDQSARRKPRELELA